jgi:hypothetical protein
MYLTALTSAHHSNIYVVFNIFTLPPYHQGHVYNSKLPVMLKTYIAIGVGVSVKLELELKLELNQGVKFKF